MIFAIFVVIFCAGVIYSLIAVKAEWLSSGVAFAIFFISLLALVIMLLVWVFRKYNSSQDISNLRLPGQSAFSVNEMPSTDRVWDAVKEVNRQLRARPGGDYIAWEGGTRVRTKLKRYQNPTNRMVEEYLAIEGILNNYKKRILILYNMDRKTIDEYYGDPPPELLIDPFKYFKPVDAGMNAGYGGYGNYPDPRFGGRAPGSINIHYPNQPGNDRPPDRASGEDVGQFFENMDWNSFREKK